MTHLYAFLLITATVACPMPALSQEQTLTAFLGNQEAGHFFYGTTYVKRKGRIARILSTSVEINATISTYRVHMKLNDSTELSPNGKPIWAEYYGSQRSMKNILGANEEHHIKVDYAGGKAIVTDLRNKNAKKEILAVPSGSLVDPTLLGKAFRKTAIFYGFNPATRKFSKYTIKPVALRTMEWNGSLVKVQHLEMMSSEGGTARVYLGPKNEIYLLVGYDGIELRKDGVRLAIPARSTEGQKEPAQAPR